MLFVFIYDFHIKSCSNRLTAMQRVPLVVLRSTTSALFLYSL